MAQSEPETFDHVTDIGQGPVIVLLHALLLDHSMFAEQTHELARNGFRVIAPSYGGHGRSPRVADVPSVDSMADQVFDLLDRLRIDEPVVLGGLSMGGYVTFAAWERYRERIRSLVLMDTRAVPDTAEEAANRLRACELIRKAGSVGPLAATMLPRLLGKTTVGNKPAVWREVARVLDTTDVEAACDALIALSTRPDRRPMLPEIDVPTLVIVGEEDLISTPLEMKTLADALPKSDFEIIPKAGHLATIESPEAVNRVLVRFLGQYS